MRNLKLLILAFGALGCVSLALQLDTVKYLLAHLLDDRGGGLILIGGFVLPTLMGLLGLFMPPLQTWQAGVALAGFGSIFIRGHMWQHVSSLMDEPRATQLAAIAVLGGMLVSLLAVLIPEERR